MEKRKERQDLINAATVSSIRRSSEVKGIDGLFLDAKEHGIGFKKGAQWALEQIEKQIDFCVINNYNFPLLHLRDFIDNTLGRK